MLIVELFVDKKSQVKKFGLNKKKYFNNGACYQ